MVWWMMANGYRADCPRCCGDDLTLPLSWIFPLLCWMTTDLPALSGRGYFPILHPSENRRTLLSAICHLFVCLFN